MSIFPCVLATAIGAAAAAATDEHKEPPRMSAAPTFSSAAQAEDFIARSLPAATAANPRYRTTSDATITEWLTKLVRFSAAPTGGLQIAMDESYTQSRGGVATPGTHKASFSLGDVAIADFTEAGDVTPAGDAARGLLFTCLKPGCVAAEWAGAPSRVDKADVYVQDDATRAQILAAFRFLKSAKSQG